MNAPTPLSNFRSDDLLVRVAREFAIDHYTPEQIRERYGFPRNEWDILVNSPRFIQVLCTERAAWQSALNTPSRIKLKSAAVVEEFLPEAYRRLHDPKELLSAKVSLLAQIAKFAAIEMGEKANSGDNSPNDKISININIGSDAITFDSTRTLDLTPEVTAEAVDDFDWEAEFEGVIPTALDLNVKFPEEA